MCTEAIGQPLSGVLSSVISCCSALRHVVMSVSLQGLQFSDKDEHMYFWFPLLAGLSELTFDPRPDIRYSALEVLFDTLKFHGSAFTLPFWTRIFDSVLLPIFDHVRAEVSSCPFTDFFPAAPFASCSVCTVAESHHAWCPS